MENLDLIDLKTQAHSPRIAIHMALAMPTGFSGGRPISRRVPPLWRWWMTIAALAIATSGLAGVVAWILRRVL